jgi:hypothetical protein
MTNDPYPFNDDQEAWLRDLETTEEPQTMGYLHRIAQTDSAPIGFCCLGRACVTLGIPGKDDHTMTAYDGSYSLLPQSGVDRLRLRGDAGEMARAAIINDRDLVALTGMNDVGMSFKEIAAYIRANPWNVFLPPEESPE